MDQLQAQARRLSSSFWHRILEILDPVYFFEEMNLQQKKRTKLNYEPFVRSSSRARGAWSGAMALRGWVRS